MTAAIPLPFHAGTGLTFDHGRSFDVFVGIVVEIQRSLQLAVAQKFLDRLRVDPVADQAPGKGVAKDVAAVRDPQPVGDARDIMVDLHAAERQPLAADRNEAADLEPGLEQRQLLVDLRALDEHLPLSFPLAGHDELVHRQTTGPGKRFELFVVEQGQLSSPDARVEQQFGHQDVSQRGKVPEGRGAPRILQLFQSNKDPVFLLRVVGRFYLVLRLNSQIGDIFEHGHAFIVLFLDKPQKTLDNGDIGLFRRSGEGFCLVTVRRDFIRLGSQQPAKEVRVEVAHADFGLNLRGEDDNLGRDPSIQRQRMMRAITILDRCQERCLPPRQIRDNHPG